MVYLEFGFVVEVIVSILECSVIRHLPNLFDTFAHGLKGGVKYKSKF